MAAIVTPIDDSRVHDENERQYAGRALGLDNAVIQNLMNGDAFFAHGPKLGDYVPIPSSPEDRVKAQEHVDNGGTYQTWTEGVVKARKEFEFAEHSRIGDTIGLLWYDKSPNGAYNRFAAFQCPLALPNKLRLTYGQINGLAGDFYGTATPISDGGDLDARKKLFRSAFWELASNTATTPIEVPQLLAALQQEVNEFNKAISQGVDPAYAYAKLIPGMTWKFFKITFWRSNGTPGYIGLAKINFDHFGHDAYDAYVAGHTAAMEVAVGGTAADLVHAYAMNAHADHFLEDMFSAGHIRTPRRMLHDDLGMMDFFCAKSMHDEDSALGVKVYANGRQPGNTEEWVAYGDKRLMSDVDNTNWIKCHGAIQASADDIHKAWVSRRVLPQAEWAVSPLFPTLAQDQHLAPLFKPGMLRRTDISKRRDFDNYTTDWTSGMTELEIMMSHMWDYKMQMDGPSTSS